MDFKRKAESMDVALVNGSKRHKSDLVQYGGKKSIRLHNAVSLFHLKGGSQPFTPEEAF